MDSVYSTSQDTMYLEHQTDDYKKSKRYFSFSEDMFFDKRVDSFLTEELQFFNKPIDEYHSNRYFYEIINDSIETYILDYSEEYLGDFKLNRHYFDMYFGYLDSNLLVLEYWNSKMYFSKQNDTSYIQTKKNFRKVYEDFYSNDTLELK